MHLNNIEVNNENIIDEEKRIKANIERANKLNEIYILEIKKEKEFSIELFNEIMRTIENNKNKNDKIELYKLFCVYTEYLIRIKEWNNTNEYKILVKNITDELNNIIKCIDNEDSKIMKKCINEIENNNECITIK